MASISNDPNGRRRIQFFGGDRKRRTIRLGKVSLRYAESVRIKVEDLVSASITGHVLAGATDRWLVAQNDDMTKKLARVGLTQRQATTLQEWLGSYLRDYEDELKPESLRKLRQTQKKLLSHFDPGKRLNTITVQQAADWRQYLKRQELSEATVKTHSGNAKTMMAEAVRRKLIADNPFEFLKSGPTPSQYARYVLPQEMDRIIDSCLNSEWRLLFGLARYAGLRIPSESHCLWPGLT